jgi:hypothetical protein
MGERQIMVVIKEPGKPARVDPLFDNTLESFQKAVGGYIECVEFGYGMSAVLVCNEEGKLRGLPFNVRIGFDDIVGAVVVCGVRGDEFASLKASAIPKVLDCLGR